MKKLLLFLTVLLHAPLMAVAQEAEPYAVYTEEEVDGETVGTVTFYYDSNKPADAMGVGPFRGTYENSYGYNSYDYPKWRYKYAKNVVFHPSFANCNSITSTAYWFSGEKTITSIKDIKYLNTVNVTDMSEMFSWCSGLTSLDVSNFNTKKVTGMGSMFQGCSGLTSLDVSNFNTENVTNMGSMFSGCSGLTSLDVSKFNTENVTSMYGMFLNCSGLTSLDVSNFNTENVTDMSDMFYECSGLTSLDVSNFNTENVTYMNGMFFECSGLTSLDVSKFNTENVTDMSAMFYKCSGLTSLNVKNFNTEKVTTMGGYSYGEGMFAGCRGLTSLDLSSFKTPNVTSMYCMFNACNSLVSLDISNFDTSNVTNMMLMFSGCSSLPSLDVSNFNTGKVKIMKQMFRVCKGLTSLDLSNFNMANVTDIYGMFELCTALQTIYCNDSWTQVETSAGAFSLCDCLVGEDGTTYDISCESGDYAHPNAGGYFTKKYEDFTAVDVAGETQYWQTYYTDTRDVLADENITVYTAKQKGDNVTIYEVADNIIPQGQAVLMRSTIKNPLLYTATAEPTGDFSKNSLSGVQRETPAGNYANQGTVYTLANGSEGLNFYRFAGDNLKANRAFLVVPNSSARVIKVSIEGETTGVEEIGNREAGSDEYFDLQGRRIAQPSKGLYIVNGKKVVRQ